VTEMDGLEDLKGVVAIGVTKRPDVINETLLRPGRFDKILEAPVPDTSARKDIVKNHMSKKQIDSSVKLDRLVEMTDGITGSDILAVVVSAAAMMAIKEHVVASGNSGKGKIRI
jgi:transitional endoplasmic reticulum ATPase